MYVHARPVLSPLSLSLSSFKINSTSGLQSARLEGERERDVSFPIKFERPPYQPEITRRHRINLTPLDSIRRNRKTIGTVTMVVGLRTLRRRSSCLFSTFNSLPNFALLCVHAPFSFVPLSHLLSPINEVNRVY